MIYNTDINIIGSIPDYHLIIKALPYIYHNNKKEVQDLEIVFPKLSDDVISRIYNMILTIDFDEPTQLPEEVIKKCIYKIENNNYITNSNKINKEDYVNIIKNGKVFINGWTAGLNGTLQYYKEDVKIVF